MSELVVFGQVGGWLVDCITRINHDFKFHSVLYKFSSNKLSSQNQQGNICLCQNKMSNQVLKTNKHTKTEAAHGMSCFYTCFDRVFYGFWGACVCLVSLKSGQQNIQCCQYLQRSGHLCFFIGCNLQDIDFCLCSFVEIHKVLCCDPFVVLKAHPIPSENLTHDCDVPIHVHLTVLCASSKAGHPHSPPGEHALPLIRVAG